MVVCCCFQSAPAPAEPDWKDEAPEEGEYYTADGAQYEDGAWKKTGAGMGQDPSADLVGQDPNRVALRAQSGRFD